MYIKPNIEIHKSFNEAKTFYDEEGHFSYLFRDKKQVSIADVMQGTRNLIVGEPGIGKSELLKKIKEQLEQQAISGKWIDLRDADSIQQIQNFIDENPESPCGLLLDGLDEIRRSLFPDTLKKIDEISKNLPDLPIYLTGRWVFINRYPDSFPLYRFVTLTPFTYDQIREYLKEKHNSATIEAIINLLSNRHNLLVIQIPRYLSYLSDYLTGCLKTHPLSSLNEITRKDLFEYFINHKLKIEDDKGNRQDAAINKRMLSKLALSMEIYQTNSISKDEVMTFLDVVESDLKVAILSRLFDAFYDNSLLSVSPTDVDKVAFENTEFQEYLAAAEITRLANPGRAAFSFAADADVNAFYPSWFNAMSFLVEMRPELIEQIIEFSGLHRRTEFTVLNEQFIHFLGKLNVTKVSLPIRRQLFTDLLSHHNTWLVWLPIPLASAMAALFDPSLEHLLKSAVEESEAHETTRRFVPLGNVAFIVGELFKTDSPIDDNYWRSKLIAYASAEDDNEVLKRRALFALEALEDRTVIDALPETIMRADELVVREFLSLCTKVDPDNPKCIAYFIEGTKREKIQARYGLLALSKKDSLTAFLYAFNTDESFRRQFLDKSSIFNDTDGRISDRIANVYDAQIGAQCKEAIIQSGDYRSADQAEKSAFVQGLVSVLKKKDPNFFRELIGRINGTDHPTRRFFFEDLMAATIEQEEVGPFIDEMISSGHADNAFSVLSRTRFYRRDNPNELFDLGRAKLPDFYAQWEVRMAEQKEADNSERDDKLLDQFRGFLGHEDKFNAYVFEFYEQNAETLDRLLSDSERQRVDSLINQALQNDPITSELTVTDEPGRARTTSTGWGAYMFGHALVVARHRGIDVTQFRQNTINYIPFAWGDQLTAIFEAVSNITTQEIVPVLDVYKHHHTDLWRYNPRSFVEAAERYRIGAAAPVLKEFVKESAYEGWVRIKALTALESLSPDINFLKETFALHKDLKGVEKALAEEANSHLITSYGDAEAVAWRVEEVVQAAQPFKRKRGAHYVGSFEEELRGKSFAKPLMYLKHEKYQQTYLRLLDEAIALWSKGAEFHEYSQYLQEVVFAYFDNLKENRSYEPLKMLERKIKELQNREGGNWLIYRLEKLHQSYLAAIGKPGNMAEAVQKYNDARSFDNKKILNSADLFRHLQEAVETDLRRWIEAEGAYELVQMRMKIGLGPGKRQYEKLIQKTLKTQIENILIRRGFQPNLYREAELLDAKRIDFLIQYGFAGPIGMEVKLTSNTDMQHSDLRSSPSFSSMQRYMAGYNAPHGIFLVIDNVGAKNLQKIKTTFEEIERVWVSTLSTGKTTDGVKAMSKQKAQKRKPTQSTSKKAPKGTPNKPKRKG